MRGDLRGETRLARWMRQSGTSAVRLAAAAGVSRRTVYRLAYPDRYAYEPTKSGVANSVVYSTVERLSAVTRISIDVLVADLRASIKESLGTSDLEGET